MRIYGLEKLSLVDFDNCTSAVVFTGACNFRCGFCHNAPLVLDEKSQTLISEEEVFAYLKKRKGLIDGVCVSGGEPTLQPDLTEFIEKVKSLGYLVKLDTNGTRPNIVKGLVDKKLIDYVAMDVKSDKSTYGTITGIENIDIDSVNESIEFLKQGSVGYEFRTTLIKEIHTPLVIQNMAKWLTNAKKMFLQKFVDSENCLKHGFHAVEKEQAEEYITILSKTIEKVSLRGY